jgi:hypothetical protein
MAYKTKRKRLKEKKYLNKYATGFVKGFDISKVRKE